MSNGYGKSPLVGMYELWWRCRTMAELVYRRQAAEAPVDHAGQMGETPALVKGTAGQPANLAEWQDSAGAVLAALNAQGQVLVPVPVPAGQGLGQVYEVKNVDPAASVPLPGQADPGFGYGPAYPMPKKQAAPTPGPGPARQPRQTQFFARMSAEEKAAYLGHLKAVLALPPHSTEMRGFPWAWDLITTLVAVMDLHRGTVCTLIRDCLIPGAAPEQVWVMFEALRRDLLRHSSSGLPLNQHTLNFLKALFANVDPAAVLLGVPQGPREVAGPAPAPEPPEESTRHIKRPRKIRFPKDDE